MLNQQEVQTLNNKLLNKGGSISANPMTPFGFQGNRNKHAMNNTLQPFMNKSYGRNGGSLPGINTNTTQS